MPRRPPIRAALAAICLILCTACNSQRPHTVHTIGIAQTSLDDAWRIAMVREMQTELSNYDDLKLIVLSADNDSERQVEQVRELIARKVDVLVISPVESAPLTAVAEEAYDSGIPTVITDRKVLTDKYTVFIGADNYKIGYSAGRFAAGLLAPLNRTPHIAEVWGLPSSSPAQERHNGFMAALADAGIRPVTDAVNGEWDQQIAAERMSGLYDPAGYDLLYSHNDVMAIAAREYFDRCDTLRSGRIRIIGVDAVAGAGLDAVADGRIDVSFLYPTAGTEVVRIARQIAEGGAVEKNIELSSAAVDRTSAETLLAQARRLDEYRQNIVDKKARLDRIASRFGSLKSLLAIIAVLCLLLGGMLFFIFRVNRKIRIRNEQLHEKSRHEEEQNRKLIALNREIERATAQKLQFFTNVSHEVRTPLTLILGPLEKLSDALAGTVYAADLELMRRNGRRLLREINQMLDFRRLENGKQELHRETVAMIPFVEEIKCYFDAAARQRGIDYRLERRCRTEAPQLFIDRSMIEKVLVNLLSNAFKYVPDAGRIVIGMDEADGKSVLDVTDNGKGIAPERLPHVFDRFFTDQDSGGTGIGLHMSHEYVSLHGGTIRAESEPGRFTRFVVELPCGGDDAPSAAAAGSYEPSEEERSAMRELLRETYAWEVLVVDDDDDMRAYVADALAPNFRVHTVENGLRAMEFLETHDVSLVVSDVMMPGMNGFELCKRIKGDMRYSHIPVLLLTALNTEHHTLYGAVTGADGYIAKPFRREYLVVRIVRLLETRQRMYRQLLDKIERHREEVDAQPIESLDDLFLRKFVGLIGQVYTDGDYNVERLCEEMAMSRSHLYRKVRELTGLSPVNYLNDYRLRRAMELLRQRGCPVSEAAYATGFSSPAYFAKMFRSRFGITPTEARKAAESSK